MAAHRVTYVAAMLRELANIARAGDQDLLTYLIEMAALEADERAVRCQAVEPTGRHKTRLLKRRIVAVEEELAFTQKLMIDEISALKQSLANTCMRRGVR